MLTTYDFNQNPIRVVEIDGEPWFVAKDVVVALGLQSAAAGTTNIVTMLDQDEVRHVARSNLKISQGSFPNRGANCISESGLYKLVMRAHKSNPIAKPFQDWVTRVVLPAIRKDGAYVSGEEKLATAEMSEDEFVLKAMSILQGKVERLRRENSVLLK